VFLAILHNQQKQPEVKLKKLLN